MSDPDRAPSDRPTFDAIYERELPYVWRTLGRLGVAASEIPDAVHDVFVVVHRTWGRLDPARPLRPWLFAIARRQAATWRRKRREVPRDDLDPASPAIEPHAERDLLWRALALLAEERRVIVILHDLDGATAPEIAEELAIPLNTVYSRLRLARADLVAALAKLEGPR